MPNPYGQPKFMSRRDSSNIFAAAVALGWHVVDVNAVISGTTETVTATLAFGSQDAEHAAKTVEMTFRYESIA